jgi:hypothetical protein
MADLLCQKCRNWKELDDFRHLIQPDPHEQPEHSNVCRQCEDPLDHDLYGLPKEDLLQEVKKLRAAIREHRDASGHDLCWYQPELWNLLPEKTEPKPKVPPTKEFLDACALYRKSLDTR